MQPHFFFALEVEETTDITNKDQISVMLCYVSKFEVDRKVREAFLGNG